jgi:hypothetical protein
LEDYLLWREGIDSPKFSHPKSADLGWMCSRRRRAAREAPASVGKGEEGKDWALTGKSTLSRQPTLRGSPVVPQVAARQG